MIIDVKTAFLSTLLITVSCSGRDIDIGNGPSSGDTAASGTTAGAGTGSSGTGASSSASGSTAGTSATSAGTTTGTSSTSGPGTFGSSQVSGPVTSGGGAAGSSGSSAAGGAGGASSDQPGLGSAIVMRYGDIPVPSSGSGSGSSATSGGGPTIDPDTPYLFVGNGPPVCSDPYAGPPCGRWVVTIGIPRSLFQSGVLSLSDPRLITGMSVAGPDRGGGDCYFGGGTFSDGTLEIVESGSAIGIRLANTATFEFNANGSYQVESCP